MGAPLLRVILSNNIHFLALQKVIKMDGKKVVLRANSSLLKKHLPVQ